MLKNNKIIKLEKLILLNNPDKIKNITKFEITSEAQLCLFCHVLGHGLSDLQAGVFATTAIVHPQWLS